MSLAALLSVTTSLYARLMVLENANGLSHIAAIAPEFRDDFTTDGNLNGRPGWTIETRPTFAAQANALSSAAGKAGGTTGSAAWALHTAAVVDARVSLKLGAVSTPTASLPAPLYHHANIDPVDANRDWLALGFSQVVSAGLLSGLITLTKTVNGGGTTTVATLAGVRPEVGDTFTSEFTTVGGLNFWTPYLNGFQVGAPVDITAWGGAFNRKHGIAGNAGASVADSFQVSNPATEAVLRLNMPGRTVPLNADGSVTWRCTVPYTATAPKALFATVYDRATGADVPVAGLERVQLASFTAAGGIAYGEVTATAAQIASGGPFFLRVIREGLVGGNGLLAESYADGPFQTPGDIIISLGQSLGVAVGSITTTTTDVYARPTDCHHLVGTPTSQSVLGEPITRLQRPVTENTAPAAFVSTYKGITGRKMSMASGGVGGTSIAQRGVGTASHAASLEAKDRLGGRISLVRWTDGQNDVTTSVAAYTGSFVAIGDDLAAKNGGAIRLMINPLSAGWNGTGQAAGTDENWQDIRRAQWKLAQDNPARFFEGAHTLDLQKVDALHLTGNSYGEMARREAYQAAKALGHIVNGRNGPSLASIQRIDAQTVRCVYNLDGADRLELVNTAYALEFHGGMVFSTAANKASGTIAAKIYPTNAVVDAAPSGGQQGINFTFPIGTFPAAVFTWACYGKDPFNPGNIAAIQNDMAGKASMIRAVRAGEPSVGLRPRFTADGLDYLTAA